MKSCEMPCVISMTKHFLKVAINIYGIVHNKLKGDVSVPRNTVMSLLVLTGYRTTKSNIGMPHLPNHRIKIIKKNSDDPLYSYSVLSFA